MPPAESKSKPPPGIFEPFKSPCDPIVGYARGSGPEFIITPARGELMPTLVLGMGNPLDAR
jgi:hypothetical protein